MSIVAIVILSLLTVVFFAFAIIQYGGEFKASAFGFALLGFTTLVFGEILFGVPWQLPVLYPMIVLSLFALLEIDENEGKGVVLSLVGMISTIPLAIVFM